MAKSNPTAKGQTIESLRVLKPVVLGELEKNGFVDRQVAQEF